MCLIGGYFFFGSEGFFFDLVAARVACSLLRVVRAIVSVERSGQVFYEFNSMYGGMINDSDKTLIRCILVLMLRRS